MDAGTTPAHLRRTSHRSDWEAFWDDKRRPDDVYSNADRILRNLQAVTPLAGKLVLEIGAGTGRDSLPLVHHGARVVQLDYAEHSLRILQQLSRETKTPVAIVGGDAFQLPFRDDTFDVVFHQGLLEHFRASQAEALLKEHIRVLRPSGLLLVDVPQRYHLYTLAKHLLIALNRWFAGWERSFSIGELERLLRNLGLTPVHRYGEWMYPSFFYRAAREAMKKLGVTLPLYPSLFSPLTTLRAGIRERLRTTPLSHYTGISIGVIARKPAA
jgi:ubiquinone/menaquinone biosynthesis C-methylase UbiE